MAEFHDLVDRMAKEEQAESSLYLGHLLMYTVHELRVPHFDVVQALAHAGLTTNLPPAPSDVNVFRRVSTNAARKKVTTADPEVFENYTVREIPDKRSTKIVRRVLRERADNNGKRIDAPQSGASNYFDEVYEIVFDRATSSVAISMIQDSNAGYDIAEEIRSEFSELQGCLNGYAVREWVRQYLENTLHATKLREGGGVYFVRREHTLAVAALERLAEVMPPGSLDIHSVPIPDDLKQRAKVRRAFEAETADEVDKLMAEIAEIREKGEMVSEAKAGDYLGKLQALTGRMGEYEEILEDQLGNARTRIQLFQSSVLALMSDNVKEA